jgi:TolB-like protein
MPHSRVAILLTVEERDDGTVSRQPKINVHERKVFFYGAAVIPLAVVLLFTAVGAVRAATATRILIIPFTIHGSGDLAFLQRGIAEMLTSRLSVENKVFVLTAGGPGDDVVALAGRNRADYVVSGSLTVLPNRVSTDARVIKGGQVDNPVLSFGRTGRQQGDVIDHIDALAGQINERILGRKAIQPVTAPPPPVRQQTIDTPPGQSSQTDAGMGSSIFSKQAAEALVPLRLPGMGEFKEQLHGLAVGDVNGDGAMEIITIGTNRLYIHRIKQGRWIKMAQYDGTGAYIGVDTADLNNNGRNEIFVTNFDNTESRVISFIMEWDGSSLQRIAGQLPWYFRAVDLTQRGKVLVGQKQSLGDRFTPGIYEMQYQNGAYGPGDLLPLPRNLNIFGFAYGAVRSPDKPEVVTYTSGGYIQLLDRQGGEASVSTEKYGGGPNAIVFTDEEQYDVQDHIYLSPRIHLYDLNGDGIQEMLVVNNETSQPGGGALVRHRFFKKGRIEWLRWYAQGVRSTMQSLDLARFIADSALVDLDGDGDLEIVAAVVKTTGNAISKGASYLAIF